MTSASGFDRALRWLALTALAAFFAVSVPQFVRNLLVKRHEAVACAGRDLESARAQIFGDPYVKSIIAIRDEIPRDGAYMLVDGSDGQGVDNWVRFDLAPRRAWFIGRLNGTKRELTMARRPADAPAYVVVARPDGEAPWLIDSRIFFGVDTGLDRSGEVSGKEDPGIPASIDAPQAEAVLDGPVIVQGWCQEKGSRPCADVRIYIDGQPLPAESFERIPRPDVEAAVAGIGRCDRAGYRARFRLAEGEAGAHTLVVVFVTGDGRYRRLGPRGFTWTP